MGTLGLSADMQRTTLQATVYSGDAFACETHVLVGGEDASVPAVVVSVQFAGRRVSIGNPGIRVWAIGY